MKIKLLLDKLAAILSDERHAQIEKYKSLKKILKALRREKVVLEGVLADAEDEESIHEIESRLKVISAQRKKGLKVLKELKEERRK